MRLPRLSLPTKVFLAVIAVCAFAVAAMAFASYISFTRGFIGYLNEQAEGRLDPLVPRFEAAYAAHGDWRFLRGDPPQAMHAWFELTRPARPAGDEHLRLPPPVSDLTGAFLRISLLDADKRFVIGFEQYGRRPVLRSIRSRGQTVGWLALTPIEAVTATGDQRFQRAQIRSSTAIALVCLMLAAVIAWWITRTLLRPIRHVADATRQLAAGAYDVQVPVESEDEAGQLARDFNRMARSLADNERMRRVFMADISHELRTPLAVLKGELEAMEDGIRPLDRAGLQSLQTEVGSLNKLVDDLFELSLAEVGGPTYRREPVDLAFLLELAVESWSRRYAQAGLRLNLDCGQAPLWVLGDERRLAQLVYNLLENSLKYTDTGGETRIAARQQGGRVLLDVFDTAPAVVEAELPRLFERFYRVEGSRNRRSGGAGLGLAICRGIAEVHGGVLRAQPSALGGLWLQLDLPAYDGATHR
ncbi:ATP-binding protein [Chitinasiproducens palmae]|uniref:histidine kinase n=1 Tax=Chitinasiproducens palmae TaxID=1770053 RepID=A0A1H2PLR1_9BURK|nr:ATP-binding protein [Chitinasiproducens palmae]SDV47321.1 two-component system, OmpR family, sensor histidine kinase BaeS [Chitinasiproducens palmae]